MKKIITCSIIISLVLSLTACGNQSADHLSSISNNSNNIEEVYQTPSPDNPEKSNHAGEDNIDNNIDAEQPSTTPFTAESTINLEDEENARNAAVEYYNNSAFAGRVTQLARITDNTNFESYVPEDVKIDTIIAFEAAISDSAAPPHVILLSKDADGDWTVVNEGY